MRKFDSGWTAPVVLGVAAAMMLLSLSILNFSKAGPPIPEDILRIYYPYISYALARLSLWVWLIVAFIGSLGVLAYRAICIIWDTPSKRTGDWLAACFSIAATSIYQFSHHLLYIPAALMQSFNYRVSRLYSWWEVLTPELLDLAGDVIGYGFMAILFLAVMSLLRRGERRRAYLYTFATLFMSLVIVFATNQWEPGPVPIEAGVNNQSRPNVIMIGSDSLRRDRVHYSGYPRFLTPNISRLIENGVFFRACYVPLARTAPSVTSMMTGLWPHAHGVRTNFVSDSRTRLPVQALPAYLHEHGYQTAAVGDWAASDLGKISFGFDYLDTAEDQWNIKYLLRQGPKDIRLFLTLFSINRFGKQFLPEIYYSAGVPLTHEVGRDARKMIASLAGKNDGPFFLNIFLASTHGPFGSSYPYYFMYADPAYRGESLYALSGVTDANEVIKRQQQDSKHFDIQQITDLYDGAVHQFDDEVGRIIDYLKESGLYENTIIVIYSDHGVDLFEKKAWGQGNILSSASHNIPLVIRDPRLSNAAGMVDSTVSSVDIAPTIVSMLGLAIPEDWSGVSLAGYLSADGDRENQAVFAETGIWVGTKIPGIPENHISYPNIIGGLEIIDHDTGTLSVKPEVDSLVIKAKARMVQKGAWRLTYFPTTNGPQFTLNKVDIKLGDRDSYNYSSLYPDVAAELTGALYEWMNTDPEYALCKGLMMTTAARVADGC